jgi:hypothetical protein
LTSIGVDLHQRVRIILLIAVGYFVGRPTCTFAQASPVATQALQLYAFGGITGTNTGLASGKNLGLTGGVDIGFLPFRGLSPTLELRGTYPIDKGSIDSHKNVLGGIKIAAHLGRLYPYGNLLFGRGEISYGRGYQIPDKPIFYTQSSSNVISPGGGLDLNLSDQFSLKLDLQIHRYDTPVTETGHLYAKSATLGVVYRFDFNHHRHSREK